MVDAAVPGVGNVIEQLADELEVETEGEHEFLRVRLAYAGIRLGTPAPDGLGMAIEFCDRGPPGRRRRTSSP